MLAKGAISYISFKESHSYSIDEAFLDIIDSLTI